MQLNKKNIIVTGASGGIGNAIVEKLYEQGGNVLATGTREEKLKELIKMLNQSPLIQDLKLTT